MCNQGHVLTATGRSNNVCPFFNVHSLRVRYATRERPALGPSCGGHGKSRGGRLEPAVECLSTVVVAAAFVLCVQEPSLNTDLGSNLGIPIPKS